MKTTSPSTVPAKASHSPLPWDMVPLSTGNFAIGAGNPPEFIAKVFRLQADNGSRDRETEANAHLIAAAPELLAALEAAAVIVSEYAREQRGFADQIISPRSLKQSRLDEAERAATTLAQMSSALARAKQG